MFSAEADGATQLDTYQGFTTDPAWAHVATDQQGICLREICRGDDELPKRFKIGIYAEVTHYRNSVRKQVMIELLIVYSSCDCQLNGSLTAPNAHASTISQGAIPYP